MIDLSDLRYYQYSPRPALSDREYILRVGTHKSGIVEFRDKDLVEMLKQALKWRRKAQWAELSDFTRKVLIPRTRFARLWRAASGGYGTPARQRPYTVRGPTLNPTHMEEFWGTDLLTALAYAIHWNDEWFDPYWVEVRGPNGRIVMSRGIVEALYEATIRAEGRQVWRMLIQGPTFEHADGKLAMRPARILEERVIA